jgi:hypothetical protein
MLKDFNSLLCDFYGPRCSQNCLKIVFNPVFHFCTQDMLNDTIVGFFLDGLLQQCIKHDFRMFIKLSFFYTIW